MKQLLRDLLGIEATASSLARLFSAPAASSCPLWGLLVIDSSGDLHFISFTQDNWVSRLFIPADDEKGPVRTHECYSRRDIRSLHRDKRGFLSSLFNPSLRYALFLEGREDALLFELESPDRIFLDALDSFPS